MARPDRIAIAVSVLALCSTLTATSCSPSARVAGTNSRVADVEALISDLEVRGFTETPAEGAYEPLEWWRAFGDPVLERIVESVLDSNFDVAEAIARVDQAHVRARLAEAADMPVIQVRGGAENFSAPINAGLGAQLQDLGFEDLLADLDGDFALPGRLGLTTLSLSADFAYELDFWDRVRPAALAAGADLLASESDVQTARLGILAESIRAYLEIADLRRQAVIAREIVDLLLERESVAETRYEGGLGDSLELYGIRQDLRNTQAALPQLDTGIAAAEARLATLMGGYREDVAAMLSEAAAPARLADPVPAGIPADLLMQRPDVRAAGLRLEAASFAIEARRADLMPSLSLSGSIGLQTAGIVELFHVGQWFSNLVSNLVTPLFDGDRLTANVELAEARFDELAAAYGRAVVTAVNEVEAALANVRNEQRRYELLSDRLGEARASVEVRSQRYASGIGGYADVLDASRTLLNIEAALAGSEHNLALARLALHRALGGAWTSRDTAAGRPLTLAFGPPAGIVDP